MANYENGWVIHACPTPGSMLWQWVSKETGMPFTTMKSEARRYKTWESANRALDKLKATHSQWKNIGNACEVYNINYKAG